MNKLLLRVACALVLTIASASAAETFEGRVTMKVTDASSKRGDMSITYAVKAPKMRMDMPVPQSRNGQGPKGMAMVIDFDKHEMLMLMDMPEGGPMGGKVCMKRPLPAPAGAGTAAGKAAGEPPTATGKTEEIAGHTAAEYVGKSPIGETYELWLAKDLGQFMFPAQGGPRGGASSPGWEAFVREGGFFPLRAVTLDAGGKEKFRMEVTNIEPGSLPDSLFSSEGYQEMTMPGMGGHPGMGGGMMGPPAGARGTDN